MRTTIDLPPDIHALASRLAHEQRRSMGEVITDLIRQGLREDPGVPGTSDEWPTLSIGRRVTAAAIRSLDDDE